jgi:hypothetical protein
MPSPTEETHVVALAALVLGSATLAVFGHALPPTVTVVGYALLFVPYAAVVWRGSSVWSIVLTALACRALFIPADPLLSDDIFRYVWDGRVALSGINPYLHPPAADALHHLRDATLWPQINHPDVSTVYPPGSQALFWLNAWLGGGWVGLKALFVGLELAGVALIWRLTDGWVDDASRTLGLTLYLLNPLVVVEVAWSGHLDGVAWTLLAVALAAWIRRASWPMTLCAAVAIAASAAVKFLALAAVPLMIFGTRGDSEADLLKRGVFALLVPVLLIATYLPYRDAGIQNLGGLDTYAASWRGNDGGYRALYAATRHLLKTSTSPDARQPDGAEIYRFPSWDSTAEAWGWTRTWQGREVPATSYTGDQIAATIAKLIVVFLVLVALSWSLVTRAGPIEGTLTVLLTLYFFAPIVHPWYVAWLVPLAALCPRLAPLLFSFTVLLGYTAWISAEGGGPWVVPGWAVLVEYGVVAGAVLVGMRRWSPPGSTEQ